MAGEQALAAAARVDAAVAAGDDPAVAAGRGSPGAWATSSPPPTCPPPAARRSSKGGSLPYDATVTARIREAGIPILGKTNMDEFASGLPPRRTPPTAPPATRGHRTGAGRFRAVAVPRRWRLSRHRWPSARTPADRSVSPRLTATVGVKPTYGTVSRYGLVACASSLDQGGLPARARSSTPRCCTVRHRRVRPARLHVIRPGSPTSRARRWPGPPAI